MNGSSTQRHKRHGGHQLMLRRSMCVCVCVFMCVSVSVCEIDILNSQGLEYPMAEEARWASTGVEQIIKC
jgi:hypothetical protein